MPPSNMADLFTPLNVEVYEFTPFHWKVILWTFSFVQYWLMFFLYALAIALAFKVVF